MTILGQNHVVRKCSLKNSQGMIEHYNLLTIYLLHLQKICLIQKEKIFEK